MTSDPQDEIKRTGSDESTDRDTQPDDAVSMGMVDEQPTGQKKASENRENESPA
jgi:hypothetical protein